MKILKVSLLSIFVVLCNYTMIADSGAQSGGPKKNLVLKPGGGPSSRPKVPSMQQVSVLYEDEYPTYYFHCVWGDYGRANGYFKKEYVNKIGGTRYSKGSGDGTYSGYEDTSTTPIYDTDVNYLLGLRPSPQVVGKL